MTLLMGARVGVACGDKGGGGGGGGPLMEGFTIPVGLGNLDTTRLFIDEAVGKLIVSKSF